MAFGQSSGPPANGKQLRELLELLEAAGHSDYRDARGPMGFSQRQAAGKFTSGEADEFIERLQTEIHGDGPPPGSRPPPAARAPKPATPKPAPPKPLPRKTAAKRPSTPPTTSTSLSNVPVEELAAELQRRGWVVLEP
jgi:hypothetical protein